MFSSIGVKTSGPLNPDGTGFRATYDIIDTCFTVKNLEVSVNSDCPELGIFEPVAIITEYSRHNLNVARNLAFYYALTKDGKIFIDDDLKHIENHFSSLNYYRRYYNSTMRYFKIYEHIISQELKLEESLTKLLAKSHS